MNSILQTLAQAANLPESFQPDLPLGYADAETIIFAVQAISDVEWNKLPLECRSCFNDLAARWNHYVAIDAGVVPLFSLPPPVTEADHAMTDYESWRKQRKVHK